MDQFDGNTQNTGIQGPAWTSWSALYRFARSPIALYGTYAALLMPLIAAAIVFAESAWPILQAQLPVPSSGEASLPAATASASTLGAQAETKVNWRIFAAELYGAGLFIVVARLLTDLFCPPRIQRFPYEDDHLVFVGSIKRAKLDMAAAAGALSDPVSAFNVAGDYAKLLEQQRGDPMAVNRRWRKDNFARWPARFLATGCFAIGTVGVVLFLAWRSWGGFYTVHAFSS